MISSWIWQLRTGLQRKQKNIADEYSRQVVALINAVGRTDFLSAIYYFRAFSRQPEIHPGCRGAKMDRHYTVVIDGNDEVVSGELVSGDL